MAMLERVTSSAPNAPTDMAVHTVGNMLADRLADFVTSAFERNRSFRRQTLTPVRQEKAWGIGTANPKNEWANRLREDSENTNRSRIERDA
jgi:uncharacterized protein (UPF0371 family)